MNKAKVALVRCGTYEEGKVFEAVHSGLNLIGGISAFTKPGEKIVMKPNVLIGSNPESCVTTHPSVFKAVGRILKESGTTVYYGDSSAFGKSETNMRKSGLKQAGDEMGFLLADFDSGRLVHHKDGVLIKNFTIANGALDADGIVSLPKFKTHGIVRFTGAAKNQFGCIPGLLKGQYHVKLADPYDFSTMLVDLNMVLKPRLYIMDGISAMEGNGPRSGKAKKMNVLLFSSDPIALDATACRIIGFDPEFVPTSSPGEKAGLGTYHAENIEVMGEDIVSFLDSSFNVVLTPPMRCTSGRLRTFVKNQICERPVIDRSKCSICGTCVKMCPVEPKAVNWHTGDKTRPPSYKYNRCIRCYCCQETCPEGAISIENPFLSKIFSR
jgi:uncharacterized protein (DUF362 family)/Pyruvate/2-oxoacid:ferredoxin oxidoreductase delta subunit